MDTKSAKIRVLFILSRLLHYRIPLMNSLASEERLNITILHSGDPTFTKTSMYKEIVVKKHSFWGWHYQEHVLDIANEYNVIIAPFDLRWLSNLLLFMRRRRNKFVWWGIGFGRYRIAIPLRVLLAKHSDALLIYTKSNREHLIRIGVDPEKIFVTNNTIWVPEPVINRSKSKRTKFLFVGSLEKRKRIEDLLNAFAHIEKLVPKNVTVDVIGSGGEEFSLRELSLHLGLKNRIKFHGRIEDDHLLREFFLQSLASISPGQAGLSVLHSFAHGVPFITMSDAISGGEIDNIKTGINGFLYDGTVEALSKYLLILANNPEISVMLGENAYQHYVQNRTFAIMVDSFKSAIRYVTDQ